MKEQDVMSPEERAEFEAFKAERQAKREQEARKKQREQYNALVDDEVGSAVEELTRLSDQMHSVKATVFGNFGTVIKMKEELMNVNKEKGQYTHSFTSSDGAYRIIIGNRTIDDYRDTVEEGIEIVKSYLRSLAKDEDSGYLVDTVMRLLSKNKKGVIQPSRVLQLRNLAEQSGDAQFLEGVQIIEESYQPRISKSFVSAQIKDEKGAWVNVPLSMTEV